MSIPARRTPLRLSTACGRRLWTTSVLGSERATEHVRPIVARNGPRTLSAGRDRRARPTVPEHARTSPTAPRMAHYRAPLSRQFTVTPEHTGQDDRLRCAVVADPLGSAPSAPVGRGRAQNAKRGAHPAGWAPRTPDLGFATRSSSPQESARRIPGWRVSRLSPHPDRHQNRRERRAVRGRLDHGRTQCRGGGNPRVNILRILSARLSERGHRIEHGRR